MEDINRITAPLGIPWEPSKDQPFAPTVNYIGFTWDIENWVVALSAGKVAKYVQAIDDWNNQVAHTLIEVQGVYGKLVHVAYALPMGWAFLTGLERMLKVCSSKPFLPHRPEKSIKDDLHW